MKRTSDIERRLRDLSRRERADEATPSPDLLAGLLEDIPAEEDLRASSTPGARGHDTPQGAAHGSRTTGGRPGLPALGLAAGLLLALVAGSLFLVESIPAPRAGDQVALTAPAAESPSRAPVSRVSLSEEQSLGAAEAQEDERLLDQMQADEAPVSEAPDDLRLDAAPAGPEPAPRSSPAPERTRSRPSTTEPEPATGETDATDATVRDRGDLADVTRPSPEVDDEVAAAPAPAPEARELREELRESAASRTATGSAEQAPAVAPRREPERSRDQRAEAVTEADRPEVAQAAGAAPLRKLEPEAPGPWRELQRELEAGRTPPPELVQRAHASLVESRWAAPGLRPLATAVLDLLPSPDADPDRDSAASFADRPTEPSPGELLDRLRALEADHPPGATAALRDLRSVLVAIVGEAGQR